MMFRSPLQVHAELLQGDPVERDVPVMFLRSTPSADEKAAEGPPPSLDDFRVWAANLKQVLTTLISMSDGGAQAAGDDNPSAAHQSRRRSRIAYFLHLLLDFGPTAWIGSPRASDTLWAAQHGAIWPRFSEGLSMLTASVPPERASAWQRASGAKLRHMLSDVAQCLFLACESRSTDHLEQAWSAVSTALLPRVHGSLAITDGATGGLVDIVPLRSLIELFWSLVYPLKSVLLSKLKHMDACRAALRAGKPVPDNFWQLAATGAKEALTVSHKQLFEGPTTAMTLPSHFRLLLTALSRQAAQNHVMLVDGRRLYHNLLGTAGDDERSRSRAEDASWRAFMSVSQPVDRGSSSGPFRYGATMENPWSPKAGSPSRGSVWRREREGRSTEGILAGPDAASPHANQPEIFDAPPTKQLRAEDTTPRQARPAAVLGQGSSVPSFLLGPTMNTASVFNRSGNRPMSMSIVGLHTPLSVSAGRDMGLPGMVPPPYEQRVAAPTNAPILGAGPQDVQEHFSWEVQETSRRLRVADDGSGVVDDVVRMTLNDCLQRFALMSLPVTSSTLRSDVARITCVLCGAVPLQTPLSYSSAYCSISNASGAGVLQNPDDASRRSTQEGPVLQFARAHLWPRFPLYYTCCGSLQCPVCASLDSCAACGEPNVLPEATRAVLTAHSSQTEPEGCLPNLIDLAEADAKAVETEGSEAASLVVSALTAPDSLLRSANVDSFSECLRSVVQEVEATLQGLL